MTTAMTEAQRRRTVSRRVDTERVRHGIARILGRADLGGLAFEELDALKKS